MKKVTFLLAFTFVALSLSVSAAPPSICWRKSPPGLASYRNVNPQTALPSMPCDILMNCEAPGTKKCEYKPSGGNDPQPPNGHIVTLWEETILEQMNQYADTQIASSVMTGSYAQSFVNPSNNVTYLFTVTWYIDTDGASVTTSSWTLVPIIGG